MFVYNWYTQKKLIKFIKTMKFWGFLCFDKTHDLVISIGCLDFSIMFYSILAMCYTIDRSLAKLFIFTEYYVLRCVYIFNLFRQAKNLLNY